jgi:hypothetical protein
MRATDRHTEGPQTMTGSPSHNHKYASNIEDGPDDIRPCTDASCPVTTRSQVDTKHVGRTGVVWHSSTPQIELCGCGQPAALVRPAAEQFTAEAVQTLADALHIGTDAARALLERNLAEQIEVDHATAILEDAARATECILDRDHADALIINAKVDAVMTVRLPMTASDIASTVTSTPNLPIGATFGVADRNAPCPHTSGDCGHGQFEDVPPSNARTMDAIPIGTPVRVAERGGLTGRVMGEPFSTKDFGVLIPIDFDGAYGLNTRDQIELGPF